MCRRFTTLTVLPLTAGAARQAVAAEGDSLPTVIPFIDSGNTLPDHAAETSPRLGRWYEGVGTASAEQSQP